MDSTLDATDASALLPRRVSLFSLVVGVLLIITGLARAAVLLLTDTFEHQPIPGYMLGLQVVAGLGLVAVWAFVRSGKRSRIAMRLAEGSALMFVSITTAMMGLLLTLDVLEQTAIRRLADDPSGNLLAWFALSMPTVVVAFLLTYVMVLRAVFVPTRPKYTLWLTVMVGTPLPAVAYVAGLGPTHLGAHLSSPEGLALGTGLVWIATATCCALISQVTYGLRRDVKNAMRLGQYTLETLIGEGGMGAVYRASHAMLRRPTAIKLLPRDRAGALAIERFEREVQLTALLTHPNTVTIFDYGRTAEGVFYYAMELLEGATLEEVVAIDGPQSPARVVRILEQVAGALSEAHGVGLIHRDIKPANIVLCCQGGEHDVAKVVDFGLVKEVDRGGGAAVSQDGTISGTPLYMAPEMLRSPDAVEPRSDLYALGAVGYYLLTGQHVFTGASVIEVLGHHLHTAPKPPSEVLGDVLPEALERLILDCLAKDPADRPKDARELRQRLEAVKTRPWKRRAAMRWWEVHKPALDSRRSGAPSSPNTITTMAVDLDRRALSL